MSVLPTVLLTGASRGIGRAIALCLADTNKYKLALFSRNTDKLNETATLCTNINANIKIKLVTCDVANTDAFKACITQIANEFGPLCVIINNAGFLYQETANNTEQIDYSLIDSTIDINLRSVIHGTVHALSFIKESKLKYPNIKCAVIQIGSRASTERAMFPTMSFYAATKFGVRAFTNCLLEEIGDFGIKVSCIMPGLTATEMVSTHKNFKNMDTNKILQPSDIAHAVQYVLSCGDTCCPLEILVVPQYFRYSKL